MGQIKDFILSLISAAAVTVIFEGLVPEGGLKKYLKYVVALFLLVVLISPLKGVVTRIVGGAEGEIPGYDSTAAVARANYIVALHVEEAVCEKFSIDEENISVKCDGEKIILTTKRRMGLLAEDITYYAANNFGVVAEVIFYE